MNKKIEKTRTDIRRMEAKLREDKEYLDTLKQKLRQLEDEEIIEKIRGMQEEGQDVLDVLKTFQQLKNRGNDTNEDA
ncbi:MAG: hypothetical protein K5852_02580 [Eubacterium sp.]|nr:hypothetical protein [Eubacterium sp.]